MTSSSEEKIDDKQIVYNFFVDEAGDLTLFNRNGVQIVGKQGVSKTFIVGVVRIHDLPTLSEKLESLRSNLLEDPYFASVPSMQRSNKKTAIAFHAKDDLPEVRYRVFSLLKDADVKVLAAFRRKNVLAGESRVLHRHGSRLTSDTVYDDLVKRIFKRSLHKADLNDIVFAKRGKSDREAALESAIEKAKSNYISTCIEKGWVVPKKRPHSIRSAYPSQEIGLQVADYYLWALQRLLKRREDRFFNAVLSHYRLIMDLDDTRTKPYGEWYSEHNPLTLEKIKPLTG